ncbi:hypothetical protein [Mesorhizobium sp. dw_380]|uniref:hypothetical protein n=1 Tax=Mesorhizobium sp. dw_380 TaxID=2812001 RepID=UPI001BDE512C|nr:hypothetical protein [Mesorhizobium sp. dw_380]
MITGYADTTAIGDLPPDVPLLGKPFREGELIDSILAARERSGSRMSPPKA